MCGFLAILDQTGQVSLNHTDLLDQIAHRGPDAVGLEYYDLSGNPIAYAPSRKAHLVLGHRRLSIIDIDPRAHQPMSDQSGRYVLVYNGEVYNFFEIKNELQSEGCTFQTTSDTEVVLQALIRWGPVRALAAFQGMFGLSFLDRQTGLLTIARDQLGIKPVFRAKWSGGFAYSSEIWPLVSLPGVSREINQKKIVQYMTSGSQEHDGTTYLDSIEMIPPGCFETIHLQSYTPPERQCYWTLKVGAQPIAKKDAVEAFKDAFLKNVRLHMRADVPLGVALSGGLDSSALVGVMRHLEPDMDLKTFSFLPGDPRWSEESWIDVCVESFRTSPHKVRPDPGDLVKDLPALLRCQGEPFGTTSIYAQFRVMQLAKKSGVKVMLDGQGADELLGGYAPYVSARIVSLVQSGRLNSAIRLFINASASPLANRRSVTSDLVKYIFPRRFVQKARRHASKQAPYDWLLPETVKAAQIFAPGASFPGRPDEFLKRTLHAATTHYGLPELLRYEDRNSMHFSLESRVPFLTAEFATLCLSLPEKSLIDETGRTKAVLRDAMRGIVPDTILDRRDKIGFRPDIASMNEPILEKFLQDSPQLKLPHGIDWDLLISRLQALTTSELGEPWVWRAINIGYWYDMVHKHPLCVR